MRLQPIFVMCALLMAASCIHAHRPERKLVFDIGGGVPFSRALHVELLEAEDFRATGSGLPLTSSGPTTFRHRRTLNDSDVTRFLNLATLAAAEWRGTGERWPDCKGARLEITGGPEAISTASGCISEDWLRRPNIREFLAFLDQFLPSGWRANEVVGF